jgi:spore germination cell wall hydrolase CwlJ-like protein
MNPIFRAAGVAAASLLAVIGTAYAAPTQSWDAVPTFSFLDHESASLQGGDLGLNPSGETEAPAPSAVSRTIAAHEQVALEAMQPAEPVAPPVRHTLAELVDLHDAAEPDDSEQECLAGAVYFESKGESLQGQLSVAEVVLNRARSGRFPASACGVVRQRGQFSFVRGGHIPAAPRASAAWRRAVAIARIAMDDMADGPAPRALFFHATRVSPGWRGLTRVATVGNHVFYR